MDTIIKGGSIHLLTDSDNWASVDYLKYKDNKWHIYLIAPPRKSNYRIKDKLVYNAKGTNNPNADNDMIVTSAGGPGYYICTGPEKLKA